MELGEVVLKFFDLMASTSDWLALNLSDLNHVFLLLLKYLVLNLPNLLLLNHSLAQPVVVSKFEFTVTVLIIPYYIVYNNGTSITDGSVDAGLGISGAGIGDGTAFLPGRGFVRTGAAKSGPDSLTNSK